MGSSSTTLVLPRSAYPGYLESIVTTLPTLGLFLPLTSLLCAAAVFGGGTNSGGSGSGSGGAPTRTLLPLTLLASQCLNAIARVDLPLFQKALGEGYEVGGTSSLGYTSLGACLGSYLPFCTGVGTPAPYRAAVMEQLLPTLTLLCGQWVVGVGGEYGRRELVTGGVSPLSPLTYLLSLPFQFFAPGKVGSQALFPALLSTLTGGEDGTRAGIKGIIEGSMSTSVLVDFLQACMGGTLTPTPPMLLRVECRGLPPSTWPALVAALQ